MVEVKSVHIMEKGHTICHSQWPAARCGLMISPTIALRWSFGSRFSLSPWYMEADRDLMSCSGESSAKVLRARLATT